MRKANNENDEEDVTLEKKDLSSLKIQLDDETDESESSIGSEITNNDEKHSEHKRQESMKLRRAISQDLSPFWNPNLDVEFPFPLEKNDIEKENENENKLKEMIIVQESDKNDISRELNITDDTIKPTNTVVEKEIIPQKDEIGNKGNLLLKSIFKKANKLNMFNLLKKTKNDKISSNNNQSLYVDFSEIEAELKKAGFFRIEEVFILVTFLILVLAWMTRNDIGYLPGNFLCFF